MSNIKHTRSAQSLLQHLLHFWENMTAPAPGITDPRASILAKLCLFVAILGVSGFVNELIFNLTPAAFNDNDVFTQLALATTLFALGLYVVSRSRYYQVALVIFELQIQLGSIGWLLTTQRPYETVTIVLSVFFSGLLFPQWRTLLLLVIALTLTVGVHLPHQEHSAELLFVLSITIMTSLFITYTLYAYRRAQAEGERHAGLLAESEARFRGAIEGSLDSFYLLKSVRNPRGLLTDFEFIDANLRGVAATGLTRDVLLGSRLCELFPINRTDGFFEKYAQVVIKQRVIEEEFALYFPDGGMVWRQHQVIPVGDGIAITSRDVTARKRSESALQASEARYRALVDAVPDLLFVFDREGMYVDYHAADGGMLLISSENIIGRSLRDVMPTDVVDRAWQAFVLARDTGNPQVMEYPLTLPTLGLRNYEARLFPGADGQILAIVRDVTERTHAVQQALALRLERERMRILADFIRDASHEFRTPLSIINSSAYLLTKVNTPEDRDARVKRIEEQVGNITRLIDSLVLMAKLDSQAQLELTPQSLPILLQMLFDRLYPITQRNQQTFHLHIPASPALIVGDAYLLGVAIAQLLENAAKHTPAHGVITLGLRSDYRSHYIDVMDTGKGIAAEALPRIFERFFRADSAHSTQGFGLGLAIVKRIIELHGGEVLVESTSGKGSIFTCRLPAISATK
ncbi:MAG: PAS domain-containing protein [Armatimonadetes bacterium]|nr:PAS domain-containing protein [Anaerolineae bacterium]